MTHPWWIKNTTRTDDRYRSGYRGVPCLTRVFYLFDKLRIDENVHDAAGVIQRRGWRESEVTSLPDGLTENPI